MANSFNKLTISVENFGSTDDGIAKLFTMVNKHGMIVEITNYGGTIKSITVPDNKGTFADITLGFDTLEPYLDEHPSLGSFVGRYANRIAFGKFTIDENEYISPPNLGAHTLHGGEIGFNRKLWDAEIIAEEEKIGIELTGISKDMDQGFPGNLTIKVTYTLNNQNELGIHYYATTDKPTILNLTNHTYFNLAGQGNGDILDQEIMLAADKTTVVDSGMIPTGEIASVKGTHFDFRKGKKLSEGIDDFTNEQINFGQGYDHNFIFSDTSNNLKLGATAFDGASGRYLEMFTTQPAVQLYTSNFLNLKNGKNNHHYSLRAAFCLETQHYPDSPNHEHFPSTVLRPAEAFNSTTIYKFSVKD